MDSHLGKEITREEACRLALDALKNAERERLLFAEREALVGIPAEFYSTIDEHFWEMV
jgi:hypothetical protein